MNERQEEMIYREGYRRGKEEEHKWWSFHCAKCTDADRPRGEWINKHEWDNGFLERECSLCGVMKPILMHTAKINFCPNCGADMRGEDNE